MHGVRKRALLLIVVAGIVVVADRAGWASVSQWREDAATVMWLGYTRGALHAPVGLVSSIGVPNPNGLVLVSVLLSKIPNLWLISTLLGTVQAALVAWFCWLVAAERRLFLIIVGPVLASILLRATSVELWSQWLLQLPNLIFIAGVLLYIRHPTPWILPLFAVLVLLSPSLYMGGAVNAVAYALIAAVLLIVKRAEGGWRGWIAPMVVSSAIVMLSIRLTWWPYFGEVGLAGVREASRFSGLPVLARLKAAAGAIIRFPVWSLAESASTLEDAPLQVDQRILPPTVFTAYLFSLRIVLVQGFVCFIAIIAAGIALIAGRKPVSAIVSPARRAAGTSVLLMAAFVLLCHVIAPLLGGAAWSRGERLDEVVQFAPFLLVTWFATPILLDMAPRMKRAVVTLTCATTILFAGVSWGAGIAVIADNLRYRGAVLGEADVPLIDKLNVVRFIAQDWKSRSFSPNIPVDYDLGGGRWDWIPSFGTQYEEWYPAPYTIGREFDYVLLRSYGLSNTEEGVQFRPFGTGRYLVTYAFKPSPAVDGLQTRNFVFGRLRLSVVQTK